MNNLKEIAYELEDYARQQGGRFWLLDVSSLRQRPGELHVVVDFEEGVVPASVFIDIVCTKHRMPHRVSLAADLTDEFKQQVLPNAMILWGPPERRQDA